MWALLAGACGDSGPEKSPPAKSGGSQAEEQLVDELGGDPPHGEAPLELCDGSAVEVVRVAGDEAIETWRELREQAGPSGPWPVLIGAPDDASVLADMVDFNCDRGHRFERTLDRVPPLGRLQREPRASGAHRGPAQLEPAQRVGDIEALAAILKDGHAWCFWWD